MFYLVVLYFLIYLIQSNDVSIVLYYITLLFAALYYSDLDL